MLYHRGPLGAMMDVMTSSVGVDTIANVAAVIVAAVAVGVGVRSARESRRLTLRTAAMTAQPVLKFTTVNEVGRVGVFLRNFGVGVAKITEITFKRGNRTSFDLPALVDDGRVTAWKTRETFGEGEYFVSPQDEMVLLELDKRFLMNYVGLPEADAVHVLAVLREALSECSLSATFRDVLDVLEPKTVSTDLVLRADPAGPG